MSVPMDSAAHVHINGHRTKRRKMTFESKRSPYAWPILWDCPLHTTHGDLFLGICGYSVCVLSWGLILRNMYKDIVRVNFSGAKGKPKRATRFPRDKRPFILWSGPARRIPKPPSAPPGAARGSNDFVAPDSAKGIVIAQSSGRTRTPICLGLGMGFGSFGWL